MHDPFPAVTQASWLPSNRPHTLQNRTALPSRMCSEEVIAALTLTIMSAKTRISGVTHWQSP